MSASITITLTADELSLINQFVDAGVEDASDHLSNWAINDGYTEEDIKEKRDSIDAVKRVMIAINDKADSAQRIANSRTTSENIHNGWVLYSANEAATMEGKGFWSAKELSWVTETDATIFRSGYPGFYALPQSLGQDRQWINTALAAITSESELDEALEMFCRLEHLPQKPAKDLLQQGDLNHYQKFWLQQHEHQST